MRLSFLPLPVLLSVALLLAQFAVPGASADEVALKSLQPLDEAEEDKYGPFLGGWAGGTQAQELQLLIDRTGPGDPFSYVINENTGAVVFGIDVGHSWRLKKVPVEIGAEFEAFFSQTEIEGALSPTDLAVASAADIANVETDLNSVTFMINAMIIMDLRRYRPRIGKIPTGFRPFAGLGVGGSQLWFRNTEFQSVSQAGGGSVVPAFTETAPFSRDEFVLAYQFFAGLEYQFTKRLAAYIEWRRTVFEKFDVVRDYETDIISGGIHLRYP